jgi:hypothetical protein
MYAADGRQSVWPEGPAAPRRRGQRRNLRSGLMPEGAARPEACAPAAPAVEPALNAPPASNVLGVWNGA